MSHSESTINARTRTGGNERLRCRCGAAQLRKGGRPAGHLPLATERDHPRARRQPRRAPPQPDDAQRSADGAGERLLARLRPLLDDFDTVLESINAFRDKPAGLLRLTVLPPAANLMLAPLLSRFLAQYPAIDMEIFVNAALTDIVAGRFDAGMRPGERVERDMIAVRIGEEIRGVVVAAPGYLARHPRPTTPKDLGAHDCIRVRFPSGVIAPWQFEWKGKHASCTSKNLRRSVRPTGRQHDIATRGQPLESGITM